MTAPERIVIVDGARTPVGSFGGALKDVPAHELGATAVREALRRADVAGEDIDEVVMGCIGQVGADAYNARRVTLAAGLPVSTPALTVNRLCGSGLQAVWSAAQEIRWGAAEITVAGGDESMSRMPFYDFGARNGYRLGNRPLVDGTMMMLTDPFHDIHMGITAERVASKYSVTREEQDEFALLSQQRAATAEAKAAFAEEIVPVEVGGRKPFTVTEDEHPKPDTTVETLAKLRPAFTKDGTVTAGNASGINDGAAAVVIMSDAKAKELGLTPLARIVSTAVTGLSPEIMGLGPVEAIPAALKNAGMSVDDIDLYEINEAFAVQALGSAKKVGIPIEKLNVNGGAIAVGHPFGMTGARITSTLINSLQWHDKQFGVESMCVGGGMGMAMVLERLS